MLGDSLISSNIAISLELDFDDDADHLDQVSKLGRMKRWLDSILDGCIAFHTKTEMPISIFEKLDNNLMFCPDEPFDFVLLVLIYSKLNAIGDGTVTVTRCQLISDMGDGFGNWYEGGTSQILPTADEWFGPKRYFDKPWWCRSDGGMIDMWVGDDDDPSRKPDILIDLSNGDGVVMEVERVNAEPAEIIKPNFKPTIITDD